jgi:hypothetical protein
MHIALTEQSVGTFDSGVANSTVFDRCLASDFVVARARKSTRRKQETVNNECNTCAAVGKTAAVRSECLVLCGECFSLLTFRCAASLDGLSVVCSASGANCQCC